MIKPLLSGSQMTRPMTAHLSEPMFRGSPPSTGNSTRVEYPVPVPVKMPQAIRLPSGDQEGPEVEKLSGCLRVAIVRGWPEPSVFATISSVLFWFRRMKANCFPSGEKPIAL